jgi:hypothetical protein
MITTYDPNVVQYWAKHGFNPCDMLNFDGVPYWQIDIPEDDERLKDPEYIQLLLQSKMFIYPAVLQKRLKLPLYTMTRGGFWVETRIGDEQDIRALPLSRNKHLIQFAYKGPGINDDLQLKQFISKKKLLKILDQALNEGVEHVGLISSRWHIEKIEVHMVSMALTSKPHPGLKLMQQPQKGAL